MSASRTGSHNKHVAPQDVLLAAVRAHIHPQELPRVAELACSPTLDWEAVMELARAHGIVPLLHRAVEQTCAAKLPRHVYEHLQGYAESCMHRNLLLMRELLKLLDAMLGDGIRVLPYKGPLLAQLGYGDLSLRQPGDLDILVPERQLAQAKAILVAHGYRLHHDMDASAEAAHAASAHEYHFTFLHPQHRIMVELHWQVVGKLFSFSPEPDDLWQRADTAAVAGKIAHVTGPEDTLLILCAHGMKHFWTRLVWICDIAEFIRTHPQINWQKLLKRAGELGGCGITLVGLLLAHRLLGAAVPKHVLAAARPSLHAQAAQLQRHLFNGASRRDNVQKGVRMQLSGGGMLQSLLLHLQTREDISSGLRYCFHRAFTPTVLEYDWITLPRPLRFLYYFVKPLRLATKYVPGQIAR